MARYHIRVFQMDSKGKHTGEYVHPDDLDLTLDAWLGQEAETQHILESLDTVGLEHEMVRVVTKRHGGGYGGN